MFSPTELLVVLAVVIIFVGGKKLPEIGHGLGKSISEFKKGIGASSREEEEKKKIPDEKKNEPQ
jgi:sec-independent protein translocase protein TatA